MCSVSAISPRVGNRGAVSRRIAASIVTSVALLGAIASSAQELVNMTPGPDAEYSPYIQENFPNEVLFGDTHLCTATSADAGLVGATKTPDDAYRFAKGEVVTSSNGVKARFGRPPDFLVVAEHAENLGLTIAPTRRTMDASAMMIGNSPR